MTKKILSFMMSAVMLIGHALPSMQVFAEEATAAEVALEAPQDYTLLIPQINGVTADYDKDHFDRKDDDGTIRLLYHEDDEVKLTISVAGEYELDKIQVVTGEKKDIPLEWVSDQIIRFLMPAENVRLQADLHIRQTEAETLAQVSEPAEEPAPAETVQEEIPASGGETLPVDTPDPAGENETSAGENGSEQAAEKMPADNMAGEAVQEAPADETDHQVDPAAENAENDAAGVSEENVDPDNDSAQTPAAMEIALEEDGFPAQGGVIRLSEWSIAYDAASFEPETSFPEVNYPQDQVKTSMLSNDVLFSVPGTYDVVYECKRVDTDRKWYVIRPVRVMTQEESTSQAIEADGGEDESDDSGDASEDEDPDSPDDAVIAESETSEKPAEEGAQTDAEAEKNALKGSFAVSSQTPTGITVSMDHEDGVYETGDTVTFSVTAEADLYVSSIVAQLSSTLENETSSQYDFLELIYNEEDESYSFTMPAEDVLIIVSTSDGPMVEEAEVFVEESPMMMILAAAAGDDEDEDWDDATAIETNKYYFTRKKGTYTLSSSLVTAQSNDHMKNVRYSVDGVTKKVQAYCIQPALSAPPSNTTYTKYVDLDGSGDERILRKALFYMYGGPAFGDTISGINIKSIMTKGGCSTNSDYYGITHYLMGYVYDNTWGGHLSNKAKDLIKDLIADLKKLPDPGNVELTPLGGNGTYSASENVYKTGTFTYKGYAENTAAIALESGVTLHNITRGTTGTGTVTINGGDSFFLTAPVGTGVQFSGKYAVTTKYPIDYHACALKFSGYQDIAFAYSTGGSITMKVDWPKEAFIDIVKMDVTTRNTLAGAVYGLYSDAGCTNLVKQFPATDANGAARVIIPVTQAVMYVKEIKAPAGYFRSQTVYPVSTVAGIVTRQEVTDERVKATIHLIKKDSETGRSPQGDAVFAGAVYGLYARGDITHPDGKSGIMHHAGDLVATLKTDANGDASVSDLYLGNYYIKETTPPVGYLIDAGEHDLSCDYEGDLVAVVERTAESDEDVKKQPFQIVKAGNDGETTDAPLLAGTGFSVYLISSLSKNADGSYDYESAQPIVVNEDGSRELFTDEKGYALSIPIPYGRYIVRETTSPHNFNPVDDFEVNVTEHLPETPQVWRVLLDEQFNAKLKIIKKDDETKKSVLLPDTEFRIYDVNNEQYVEQVTTYPFPVRHTSYFTDSEGSLILPNSLKLGRYRIEEIRAPEGYTVNTEYPEIEVDDNTAHRIEEESQDVIIEVDYENHAVKGKLTVYKEGEMLTGWNGKEFTYEMQKLKDAVFEVRAAEDIYTPDHQKDQDGNRTVIYHKGEKVAEITTGEGGMATLEDIPLGKYEVREKTAPYGFTLNADVKDVAFNYVDQDTPVISEEMTFTNDRQKVSITTVKKDAETQHSVAGAVFGIYNKEDIMLGGDVLVEADTLLEKAESGEDGIAQFTLDFPLGQYYVKEVKAPEGYYSSDETVDYDASYRGQDIPVVELTADKENEPTEADFTKSDITTGVELDGATLTVLDEKRDVIETWTSVKNEPHVIKRLLIGKNYTLREEFAPYGYLVANEVTFTIEDSGIPTKVEMKDEVPVARLLINKKGEFLDKVSVVDTVKGIAEHFFEYISGNLKPVTFEVYAAEDIKAADGESEDYFKKDDLVATITTNDDGIASAENLPVGKYYVKEVETAYGYVLDDEIRYVDLSYRDQYTPIVTYDEAWQNARQKVAVTILKIEKDTERLLAGGVFGLYSREDIISQTTGDILLKKDELIEQKTTDENGMIRFIADLPIDGKYYVKELYAPPGFVTTHEVKDFTSTYEGPEQKSVSFEFIFEDEPTTVEFTKSILTTGEELEGAHLKVTNALGEVMDEWVSGKEHHIIKELVAGQIYTLTETKPADGYATAEEIDFVVSDTAEVQKIEMKDDVTKLEITKSNITDGKPVIGAMLTIKDPDGNEVASWTTTEEPFYIEMLPIGEYTLTEVTAPDGYATSESITFRVEDTGEIQKVDMKDAPITVDISKKDIVEGEEGNELPGAKLEVKNEKGDVIDSWTSGQEPHRITMLTPGKYTLIEITAPNGYEVAENVEFTVEDTGDIQKVTMYDSPKEDTVDLTGKTSKTTGYTPGSSYAAPVQTGDDTPLLAWILMAVMALLGACGIILYKRRQAG